MYVAVSIIEYLDLNGRVQTFRVVSSLNKELVTVDKPGKASRKHKDIPNEDDGAKRFPFPDCEVITGSSAAKLFVSEHDLIDFHICHGDIPLLPENEDTIGLYHLILPANFELTALHIINPNEVSNDGGEQHFRNHIFWDIKCRTHLVKIELRSSTGKSSFLVKGKARLAKKESQYPAIKGIEPQDNIINCIDLTGFNPKAKEIVFGDLSKKIDWLRMRPHFFGLEVHLNQVIQESIEHLKAEIREML